MHFDSGKAPIRVVYVVFEASGGMRQYAESLSVAMSTLADSTLVIPKELEELCPKKNGFRAKLMEKYNPLYYFRLADVINDKFHPALVHITSASVGLPSLAAALMKRKIQVVYTVHDPIPHERKKRLWDALIESYHYTVQLRWVVSKCSAAHFHTTDHLGAVRHKFGKEAARNGYVVQHGGGATPAVVTGEEVPQELREESSLFTFLFFGRIEPYKGLAILLSAFEKLSARNSSCRLIVAGAGTLKEKIRLPAGRVVLINRFIKDAEIKCLFRCARALVLPYLSATQSGVIPLAYEFGCPVICSAVGGLPEMVLNGQTGLLIPPGDVEALENSMRTLAENWDAAREMGEKGKAYMVQHFSWGAVARQHFQKYNELLAGNRMY